MRNNNFIHFRDSVQLHSLPLSQEFRDNYVLSQTSQLPKTLRVKFAATHAGKVTRNNGFYLPNEMRLGVSSWTAQYNKPILVHHNDEADPIGRVISAEYIDISQGIKAIYQKNNVADSARISDAMLTSFVDGLSFDESFSIANQYLINDQQLIDDPDYEGLGYIQLVVDISDQDAIQKILDGRYLTGSVGATTNKAVCSICKKDWAQSGMCDHRPGKPYEGKKCVLIAGKLIYDEYSIVNKPADRHSRIIEINNTGLRDSVTLETLKTNGTLNSDTTDIILLVVDNENTEESGEMELPSLPEILALIKRVNGVVQDTPDAQLEQLGQQILADVEFKTNIKTGMSPEEAVRIAIVSLTDKVKNYWGTEYDTLVGDDHWGRNYAEMIMDAIENETDPVIKQAIKDAKLSSERRKSLASSVFCGPNRSFPVPDCAHVTAARRLVGRYNGEGSKESILACVNRKAKRLGCDSRKDSVVDVGAFDLPYFDQLSDIELVQLRNGALAAMQERGLSVQDSFIATVVKNNDQLESTQTELKNAYADLGKLQDEINKITADHRSLSENYLFVLSFLVDATLDKDTFMATLKDKSLASVSQLIDNTLAQVDLNRIKDKLVSSVAIKKVDDPTLHSEDVVATGHPADETIVDDNVKRQIMINYSRLLKVNQKQADSYLEKVQEFFKKSK